MKREDKFIFKLALIIRKAKATRSRKSREYMVPSQMNIHNIVIGTPEGGRSLPFCKSERDNEKTNNNGAFRILFGISGSGKTWAIKQRLISKSPYEPPLYIVERENQNEYSSIFSRDFANIMKPNDIQKLSEVKNAYIIIDCNDNSDAFMEKILSLAINAQVNKNDISIALCDVDTKSHYIRKLLSFTTEIILFDEKIFDKTDYSYLEERYKNVRYTKN